VAGLGCFSRAASPFPEVTRRQPQQLPCQHPDTVLVPRCSFPVCPHPASPALAARALLCIPPAAACQGAYGSFPRLGSADSLTSVALLSAAAAGKQQLNPPALHHVYEQEQTRGKGSVGDSATCTQTGEAEGPRLRRSQTPGARARPTRATRAGSRPQGKSGLRPVKREVCQIGVDLQNEGSRPGAGSRARAVITGISAEPDGSGDERKNDPRERQGGQLSWGSQALRVSSSVQGSRCPGDRVVRDPQCHSSKRVGLSVTMQGH